MMAANPSEKTAKGVDIVIQDEIDWDAAFEKDLALAMKISLEDMQTRDQSSTLN